MSLSEIKRLNFGSKKSTPVILQSEISECGLAAIAMIVSSHGYKTDIRDLRSKYPVSARGTTLEDLAKILSNLEFSTRALRLELTDIPKIKLPCILHWDMNHFVVLVSTSGNNMVIHDPVNGRKRMRLKEASDHFTGVALEVMPNPDFAPKSDKPKLGLLEILQPISGLWRGLLTIVVLSFAIQILALVTPYYSQIVIDKIIPKSELNFLNVLGLLFLFLAFFHTLVDNLRNWVVLYLSSTISIQVVSRLMSHLLSLPLDFFEKRHLGDISSRFSSLAEIQRLLTAGFVQGVVDGVMVVITLGLMFFYSVKLTLVALVSFALFSVIQFAFYRTIREKNEDIIVEGAKSESAFLESLSAIQPLKAFGKENQRHGFWINKYANHLNSTIDLGKFQIGLGIAHGFIAGSEGVILIWLAGYELISGSGFSVGMFFAFMAYSGRFSSQSKSLVGLLFDFKMLSLHLERVADIALHQKEQNIGNVSSDIEISGHIKVEKLSFRYGNSEQWVFRDIELEITQGQCIVIIGPSGCGKTTLLKVLMGLLKPEQGQVNIDNLTLNQLGLNLYRSQVASVMQDDQLFSGSILENISFFEPKPDFERIVSISKSAGIHKDIEMMPMRYHTHIGSMGIALSGGQKQRLLLARALYQNPKVLFLDEATSHLDTETELLVNNAISNMGITRIMVAHRESTIALADKKFDMTKTALA